MSLNEMKFDPEITIEIFLQEEGTLREMIVADFSRLARHHVDFTHATARISQPAGGHDPVTYLVALKGSVGNRQIGVAARRTDPFAAYDAAMREFEAQVRAQRDVLDGPIENPLTNQIPREVAETIVDDSGDVVPDVDTALVLEEHEVGLNLLEKITRENQMPLEHQVPKEKKT